MKRGERAKGLQLWALWALGAALLIAPSVSADEGDVRPRVAIQMPERHDALLEEALVRIQGELGAMGFDATVQASGTGSDVSAGETEYPGGTLLLERDANLIRIRASGPAAEKPVVQELDVRTSEVTAEVVAVLAVEALRAVVIQRREAKPPPPKPAPQPPPTPPVESRPPANDTRLTAASLAPRKSWAFSVLAAPGVFLERSLRTPSAGAELGLFWGSSGFFAGATGSTALTRATFETDAGEVQVRRATALGRVGYAFELGSVFEAWLLAGGGLTRYSIAGHPAAGFVGANEVHTSPLFSLGAGATAWLAPHVGTFLRVDSCWATDAANVRVNYRELVTLERPTLWLALGLAVRATP